MPRIEDLGKNHIKVLHDGNNNYGRIRGVRNYYGNFPPIFTCKEKITTIKQNNRETKS